jgi:hypothetical protein
MVIGMRDRTLNSAAWASYFRIKAPFLQGARVSLEILDPQRNRLRVAEHTIMMELTYDPEAASLRLTGPELEHVVEQPDLIKVVEDESLRPTALEITDARGIRHVLLVQPPLALG